MTQRTEKQEPEAKVERQRATQEPGSEYLAVKEQDGKKRSSYVRAFKCACEGVRAASRERNFRIELCFAAVAVLLNVLFRVDLAGWLAVAICIGMVLAFEALNTAIEALVDLVSPEYHDLAKRAKDCAAGAVLLASLAALAVACLVWLRF